MYMYVILILLISTTAIYYQIAESSRDDSSDYPLPTNKQLSSELSAIATNNDSYSAAPHFVI